MSRARRRAPRVEATFRVSYSSVDQLLVAYSADLSKGGMFLQTDRFLPVNAVIRINLELGEGSAEIPIICRVVYVRDAAAARAVGKPAGHGHRVPRHDAPSASGSSRRTSPSASATSTARARRRCRRTRLSIMIVDDDQGCRTLAAQPFRTRGDYVRVAPDGFEALAQCLKETPDVIVSDVHMPRLDGWQLLRMCRARPTLSSVPFLFLTTLAGEQERLRGYQLGVDDYMAQAVSAARSCRRASIAWWRACSGRRTRSPRRRRCAATWRRWRCRRCSASSSSSARPASCSSRPARRRICSCARGSLLRVEVDGVAADAASIEVVYDVLGWRAGQFEFAAHEVPGEDLYDTTITALLLDHARFSDENER